MAPSQKVGLRGRWHGLPALARWLLSAALLLLSAAALSLPALIALGGAWPDWTLWVSGLAGGLVLLAAGYAAQQRRLGGAGQQRLMRRALRTGRVPDGADRGAWAAEVPRAARSIRVLHRVLRVAFPVLLVLVVVASSSMLIREPTTTVPLVVATLLLLALLFAAWRHSRRTVATSASLVEELARSSPGARNARHLPGREARDSR